MMARYGSVNNSIVSAGFDKRISLLVALSVLIFALQGCQTMAGKADTPPLGEAEVQRLFVGNTVESYNLNTKFTSFTYYHPNGELIQERLWARRTGTWTIEKDGSICLAFNKRKRKCRRIVHDGKSYYKVLPDENGQPKKIVRYRYFAAGNALARK